MPNIFEQRAAQLNSQTQAGGGAPTAQPSPQPTGDIFIQRAAQQSQQQQAQPEVGEISAVPEPKNVRERVQRWAENVTHDLKYGTDLTGVGSVLKKMGAHGVYAGNPEAVGDFMASLPLGLLRSTKGGAEVAQGKKWQGTKDVVGGALQAGEIPSYFMAPEGAEMGAKAASKATEAVENAVVRPFQRGSVQSGLQGTIRETLGKVAEENGVAKPASVSIRDVAKELGDTIQGKSKAMYAKLDEATGGRFQRFSDALENINKKLRDIAGTDDEREAALLKQREHYQQVQERALTEASSKGVDPKLIDEARANWKRAQALYDLDARIKRATGGMRPAVGSARDLARDPETVDPKKFFAAINSLFDSGRLQDAIGNEAAGHLFNEASRLRVEFEHVLRNQKIAKTLGYGAAATAGAGATGGAVIHSFGR